MIARPFDVCAGSTWYRDADGDMYGDTATAAPACAQPAGYVPIGEDCDDANAAVWSVPGEVGALGFSDDSTMFWAVPEQVGGVLLRYDVLRTSSGAFDAGAVCLATDVPESTLIDPEAPTENSAYYYLVRARNGCGAGSLGTAWSGSERIGRSCP